MHTMFVHIDLETFLQPAVRAPISSSFVDHTPTFAWMNGEKVRNNNDIEYLVCFFIKKLYVMCLLILA